METAEIAENRMITGSPGEGVFVDTMSGNTFERFSTFIEPVLGIKMPANKKTMLQSRLIKRMRVLGFTKFDDYCDYVFSPLGQADELHHMIDMVTTNKTDFFREPAHFDYLEKNALPELHRRCNDLKRTIRVWSCASSTGEEPYSIAMAVDEFIRRHSGIDYRIIGSDISMRVLKKAVMGIYDQSRVQPIPMAMRKQYLLRGRGNRQNEVRIVPELRSHVEFRKINLMDSAYPIEHQMDIIFCRNVIIYFDRSTQKKVLCKLCEHLAPGGYLFMGHAETLTGMDLPLKQVKTAVYQRTN